MLYASRKPKDGKVAAAWMVLYGIGRYGVEMLRNDDRGGVSMFSTSQIISIGMVVVGCVLWVLFGKKNKTDR